MKSTMMVAALFAAACVAAPMTVQAASPAASSLKGMTDTQLYCSLFAWTAKCAPATATAKPAKTAMAKPAAVAVPAAKATPKLGIKTLACAKAEPGKAYLYTCSWH
jgi:hypothetical protein